jgi:hypothetical protein
MQYEVFYRDREYGGWTADIVEAIDNEAAFYARWAPWHPWNDYARSQVRLISSATNTGSEHDVH